MSTRRTRGTFDPGSVALGDRVDPQLGRPVWGSRISWAGLLAGVVVGLASMITLSALGTWAGFGLADVATIDDLSAVATGVGIWTAISALIALFLAGMVASWLAGSRTTANGLWHGLTVWALTIVGAMWLSLQGVAGVTGFAITPQAAIDALPGDVSPDQVATAVGVSATFAGWFLLAVLLGLGAALIGGWVGTFNRSEEAAASVAVDEEYHRAA